MSAKHQENDTPVKASHLLLVIAVCQVLVPEHCLLGEPPKHEKFVSFHKSSVEWWPFVTYPAPPEPLHHCLKRNGIKRKKINTSLTLPWQRHRLPQGGANVFWIQDPPFPKKVTGGCPCCLATGQYPQLPKFLESEPTYENKAWDLLSEQDQSL